MLGVPSQFLTLNKVFLFSSHRVFLDALYLLTGFSLPHSSREDNQEKCSAPDYFIPVLPSPFSKIVNFFFFFTFFVTFG